MDVKNPVWLPKEKPTSQVLFIARRRIDMAERQAANLTLVLLDWEEAFDKIDQNKLIEVLSRLCVPQRVVRNCAEHLSKRKV